MSVFPRPLGATPADAAYQTHGPDTDPRLERKLLARTGVGATATAAAAEFVVATPNVKCITLVRVFVRVPGDSARNPFVDGYSTEYNAQASLWIAARATPVDGSKEVPVADYTTPTFAIPITNELWGHEIPLETVGQEVRGLLTVPAGVNPAAGMDWHVSVRYQAVQACTPYEWARLINSAGIRVATGEGKAF